MRRLWPILWAGVAASIAAFCAAAALAAGILRSTVEQFGSESSPGRIFGSPFDLFGTDVTGPLGPLVGAAVAVPVGTVVILALLWPRVTSEAPDVGADH